jgi:hypothetical protein
MLEIALVVSESTTLVAALVAAFVNAEVAAFVAAVVAESVVVDEVACLKRFLRICASATVCDDKNAAIANAKINDNLFMTL